MRIISAIDKGSSPRVRGEAQLSRPHYHAAGIIPAGAGRSKVNCSGGRLI